ncbi:MAG: UDP-N-acetylglucosamine 1-carboxyvinyltransferase [Clostridia bacterium]|nr:UDP-N-acetylglucosamine 1-carboxyvinyltransferase [Clostridia bacterium]
MEKFIVRGPCTLKGEVNISGAKNAAVAILPATLLVRGKCHLENVPDISDIRAYYEILESLGSKITYISKNEVIIDNSEINSAIVSYELTSKFRASYYLLGSLLGRFDKVQISLPGGCNLGARPIDQHIKAFEKLGATIEVKSGNVYATRTERLKGAPIFLDVVSVGATINAILSATLAEGITVIENVAKEPHVVDVANFLNSMGAKIKGAGTDSIKVTGVTSLEQVSSYSIIPDQIETGTFMVAAAVTKGDVLVKNCIPKHMEPITAKLIEAGATVEEFESSIRVSMNKRPSSFSIKTMPYPGFPTDMQPQMSILLCLCDGTGMIVESIWESRFLYTDELAKMGADISAHGTTAIIKGVDKLYGAPVKSHDLRAGAAMIIAGLVAEGDTEVTNIAHILRGYEDICQKFSGLGANIEYVVDDEVNTCD